MSPKSLSRSLFFHVPLPAKENWAAWTAVALVFRIIVFVYKITTEPNTTVHYPGIFASEAGDTVSYFQPIDNWLHHGVYMDDHRMPGYGWVYLLLRLALSVEASLDAVAILQLITACLSVYVLAVLAAHLLPKHSAFHATFVAFGISTYTALWDHVLLAESFCTSALIFSLYFLLTAQANQRRLFLSGLMLTWAVFLRPVSAPLLGLFCLYVVLRQYPGISSDRSTRLRRCAILLAPFLILDGIWAIRNHRVHNGFYPLMTTIGYKGEKESHLGALARFVQSFGGSTVWWAPRAEMTFFIPLAKHIKSSDTQVRFPEDIFTSKFDQSSLNEVRDMIAVVRDDSTPPQRKREVEASVIRRLDSYTASIRDEKPFLYHVKSRLRIAKTFLLHSGTYNLFSRPSFELRPWEFCVKVFYSLLYCLVVLMGLIGCLWLAVRGGGDSRLLALTTVYLTFVHPILFRMDEFRYLSPGYPFLLLCSVLLVAGALDAIASLSRPPGTKISPGEF